MVPVDYMGKVLEGPSPCICPFCGKPDGNLIVLRSRWKYSATCSLCGFGVSGGDDSISVLGIVSTIAQQLHAARLLRGALADMVETFESEMRYDDDEGRTLPYPEVNLAKQALRVAMEAGVG